jgi:hypothetical protein
LVSADTPTSASFSFVFSIVAPSTPGTYRPALAMFDYNGGMGGFFGPIVNYTVNVSTTSVPQYGATLMSQNFPAHVSPGQTFTATVVMQNSGSVAWDTTNFFLYNRNNPVNLWGLVWVHPSAAVAPGASGSFLLHLRGPATLPSAFLWQMYLPSFGFFGDLVSVAVSPPPPPRLFVSNNSSHSVAVFDMSGASLGTLPAPIGASHTPGGLATSGDGTLYVGDQTANAVLRYDATTLAFIDTFVPPGSGGLTTAYSVADGARFGDPHLYAARTGGGCSSPAIFRYDSVTGAFTNSYVVPGDCPIVLALASAPAGLYFTGYDNGSCNPITMTGNPDSTFLGLIDPITGNIRILVLAQAASCNGGVLPPLFYATAIGGTDHAAYVALLDRVTNTWRIDRYNATTGALIGTFVAAGTGGLTNATDLAFGPDGNLYVMNEAANQVLKFDGTSGAFLSVFASGLQNPFKLAFGP